LRFAVSACMSVRESQHHSAHPSAVPSYPFPFPFPSFPPWPMAHEPITLLPQQAQPLCPRPDKTRSQTQGLSNSKRNAHPFLNNLARPASLHALHREIALPATGTPTIAPAVAPSLTSFSRFSPCLPCRTPASMPCQSRPVQSRPGPRCRGASAWCLLALLRD
jgi:hypothetical protein